MINKKRRFAWYIYLELLFFKLYVLIFKDLAATIVSIYWGHFLYYHSFIPLPTSLAKVVNLLLSSLHGSYIIAGQWHAPTKLTALPNYACFAVQRLIYIYIIVLQTRSTLAVFWKVNEVCLLLQNEREKLGFFDEGHLMLMCRRASNEATVAGEPGSLEPTLSSSISQNFQLHIDCISFAREDRVPTISD